MLQQYVPIIIVITALFIIAFILLVIKKKSAVPSSKFIPKPTYTITSHDIKAIAGDNVIATELDLARAYLEIGKKQLAKQILGHVTQHGDVNQQQEAQRLMASLR